MCDDKSDCQEEAPYEADDIGCDCGGVESEWVWNPEAGLYICAGCNAVQ